MFNNQFGDGGKFINTPNLAVSKSPDIIEHGVEDIHTGSAT
jgi:hypothetical protein